MTTVPVAATRRLEYLPIALFGSVMGLTGLSVAWHLASVRYRVPEMISSVIGVVAVIAFIAVSCGYVVKWISAPDAVRAEFSHPIASNLFGTFLISLLLLPIVLVQVSRPLAQGLWIVGAVGMVGFAWLIIDRWLGNRQQAAHATPAWIVPVVGMLDIPLALPVLGLPPMHGVMVLGLAVGLFFAVPLFTLIFSRLLFEPPLPDQLQPSLMILLAPSSVGMSTYVATTGEVDLFAQALYALTLFLLAVLLSRLRNLARCCPFRVSWWAVSFPLASTAVAALRIATAYPGWINDTIACTLLAGVTLTIVWLLGRTVYGIVRGELRTLSG